jgi:hypothetical protein
MCDVINIEALSQSPPMPQFKAKDWLYIQDQSNGIYSNGQLQFDTMATANNNQYVIWSDAFIVLPYIIQAQTSGAGAFNLTDLPLTCAWKNGYYQAINSAQIVLNGVQLNNLAQNVNILTNYKVLTEWTSQQLKLNGPTYCVSPDSADAYTWAAVGGTTTNRNAVSIPASAGSTTYETCVSQYNAGLTQRGLWNGYNAASPYLTAFGPSQANIQSMGRNNFVGANNGVSNVSTATYMGFAIIPLSHIHDCFKQMNFPLKNCHFQFTINLNGVGSVATNPATNAGLVAGTSFTGNTWPVLVSTDNGMGASANGVNKVTLGFSNTSLTGADATVRQPPALVARLYYPVVQFPETIERAMVGGSYKRLVNYMDHQFFSNLGIATGTMLNWTITNGISNLKKLIFIPFLAASATTTAASAIPQIQSPVDPAPGTTAPYAELANIQLMLNGKNYYSNPISYDFEQFVENTKVNTLNGGDGPIVSSLIDQYMWSTAYKFYVFDVSRNNQIITPDTPVAVQLITTITSSKAVDLYCFALYESAFVIDQSSASTHVVKSQITP